MRANSPNRESFSETCGRPTPKDENQRKIRKTGILLEDRNDVLKFLNAINGARTRVAIRRSGGRD
jgi:hypothetical protein